MLINPFAVIHSSRSDLLKVYKKKPQKNHPQKTKHAEKQKTLPLFLQKFRLVVERDLEDSIRVLKM